MRRAMLVLLLGLAIALVACGGEHGGSEGSGEHGGSDEHGASERGESDEGEESGAQFARTEVYDHVRAGARLIIRYDAASNTFIGTVENVTADTLERVRVEVHLSNGVELGPTTPTDLAPGQVLDVTLRASAQPFDTWSAHPEVGSEEGEHGGEEGSGEHGGGSEGSGG